MASQKISRGSVTHIIADVGDGMPHTVTIKVEGFGKSGATLKDAAEEVARTLEQIAQEVRWYAHKPG